MKRPLEFSDIDPPFLRGYIMAALFTEDPCPPGGGIDYRETGRDRDLLPRLSDEFLARAEKDCQGFQIDNREDIDEAIDTGRINGYDEESAGMDFWYSRNGHGCGYFDRDLGDIGDTLQDAAQKRGEVYLEFEPEAVC